MILKITLPVYFIFAVLKCFSQEIKITAKFDSLLSPAKPDYSLYSSWASLPFIKDCADTTIGNGPYINAQNNAPADVFFIHPTTFTYKPDGKNKWNGDTKDEKLNIKTSTGSIRYQASVFNEAGKIYAPYYRQAHYFSYFTSDTSSARKAFELAYADVRDAFLYYLKNYNDNRPFIIASHSQGTTHAIRLIQELIDGKPLGSRMICAYLIGMPVYDTVFRNISPCKTPGDTLCFCSWRTLAVGYYPKNYKRPERFSVCTNPLIWTIDDVYVPSKYNKGGITWDMRKVIPGLCDAQIQDGVLRINRPNFRGSAFLRIKNYHIADYNLFYSNIKENAVFRTRVFLGL